MVIPNVAIKKIVLYFLVLLTQVCTFNVFAQIKANVETKESTCSSNGSIQLNVSGGTAPYIYEMKESPEGVKRNPQSNSLFDYLPGGRYLFIIKDAQGSYLNVDVNLLGNYNEPVLDCSVNDNTTTANLFVRYGKAPFLYSMSLDNGKNWSAKQSDSNFECIRNGTSGI
jgi:hypothetical protein